MFPLLSQPVKQIDMFGALQKFFCMMNLLVKRPLGRSALHFVVFVLGDGFPRYIVLVSRSTYRCYMLVVLHGGASPILVGRVSLPGGHEGE